MKFLIGADVQPNPDSGAAGTVFQTIRALRALGHDVDEIWADDLGRRIRHGNLHYLIELPHRYVREVKRRMKDKAYDVVMLSQPHAWKAGKYLQQHYPGTLFMNRSHGWEPRIADAVKSFQKPVVKGGKARLRTAAGIPVHAVLNRYPRWCAQYADGLVVSCSEDRDYIIEQYEVSPSAVAVIPLAPSPVFCQTDPLPMTSERSKRVLYVGQAATFKGPHILADVYSRLADRFPELQFTWCCPEADHERCSAMLSDTARQRTHFQGWMSQQELVKLYDEHGLFIFPPFTEGFGKVFLEAMARGLCVVASNAAGMRDVIENGVDGRRVTPGDASAFCDAAAQLLENPEVMQSMSTRARQKADGYTWQETAQSIAEFCQARYAALNKIPSFGKKEDRNFHALETGSGEGG